MKRTNDPTRPGWNRRRGRLSASALLGFALVVGACTNDGSVSSAPATTDATTGTTTDTTTRPSTVDGNVPVDAAPRSDELEAYFDQIEERGFSGVVAIRDGAEIDIRAFGLADRENDIPTDQETVFDIGSITKQFTGAAILRLEMDGMLSVDDTLGQHLPGLPDDKAAITLHQLLTNTAGLPVAIGPDDEPIGRSEYVALAAETPLLFEPGRGYEYSNVGFSLLAVVIEVVTGEPYETYLRTALLEPAGMLDTGYVLPDWDGKTIAVGYEDATGDRFGRPNEQPWDVDGPYWHLRGNGGILSTAADMLRWDEALMGDDVLDASAKAKFFAPHTPLGGSDSDVQYGYGWVIVSTPMGTPLITHSGSNGIFWADILRFVDQDVTVFAATNSADDDGGSVAGEVADLVLGVEVSAGGDELHCDFEGLTIASLPDYAELEELPDSPAGRAAMALIDVLTGGDAAARLDFADNHVSEQLGGGDPAAIDGALQDLQAQFADSSVVQIFAEDDLQLHVLMQGPGVELLLSLGVDRADPERLACLGISD